MKVRTFRAPDDEWEAARNRAAREEKTMTEVLRRALREYADGEGE